MEHFYSAEDGVAWGPLGLDEIKDKLLQEEKDRSKIKRRGSAPEEITFFTPSTTLTTDDKSDSPPVSAYFTPNESMQVSDTTTKTDLFLKTLSEVIQTGETDLEENSNVKPVLSASPDQLLAEDKTDSPLKRIDTRRPDTLYAILHKDTNQNVSLLEGLQQTLIDRTISPTHEASLDNSDVCEEKGSNVILISDDSEDDELVDLTASEECPKDLSYLFEQKPQISYIGDVLIAEYPRPDSTSEEEPLTNPQKSSNKRSSKIVSTLQEEDIICLTDDDSTEEEETDMEEGVSVENTTQRAHLPSTEEIGPKECERSDSACSPSPDMEEAMEDSASIGEEIFEDSEQPETACSTSTEEEEIDNDCERPDSTSSKESLTLRDALVAMKDATCTTEALSSIASAEEEIRKDSEPFEEEEEEVGRSDGTFSTADPEEVRYVETAGTIASVDDENATDNERPERFFFISREGAVEEATIDTASPRISICTDTDEGRAVETKEPLHAMCTYGVHLSDDSIVEDSDPDDAIEDDTIGEIEAALKHGLDYQMPDEIFDSQRPCVNKMHDEPLYPTPQSCIIHTPKASAIPLLKKKTPSKYEHVKSRVGEYIKNKSPNQNFKIPSRPIKSKLLTPNYKTEVPAPPSRNFKDILSPISVYIKNSASPCFRENVPVKTISSLPVTPKTEIQNFNKENDVLPEVIYKPSKKIVSSVQKDIVLPPSLQKMVHEPVIEIHKGTTKPKMNQSVITKKLFDGDLTSIVNESGDDISFVAVKQAYIK